MADSTNVPLLADDWVCPVIKISIPWMLETVAAIDDLTTLGPSEKYGQVFIPALHARGKLEILFGQSVYSPYLRSSRDKGNALYAAIGALTDDDRHEWEAEIQGHAAAIQNAAKEFKLVFTSEISTLPAYLVEPKENYDVTLLIDRGAGLFPANMLAKVPDAAFDAGEVGKTMAFNLPTACAFHTFRVLECVLKKYWDFITSEKARPDPETIGKIAADMINQKIGDDKVLESLKQIAKLHRNPCIHEVRLNPEEAIGTLGIVRSVIVAMLSVLPDAPLPTTVAS